MIRTEDGRTIARDVEYARGFLSKARGLMFRRSIPDGYALVFEFDRERPVSFHMFFVPFDIDIVFLDSENRVTKTATMEAWTGRSKGKAKRVIELPEGGASTLKSGDKLVFY
ncbi:MAG: DUF192 domain-containing protein [Halobacteria archaeon]|nr:DUF192 domain-containing protein [Halobacteria archaeon]